MNKRKVLPIIVICVYLLFTVLVSYFGPKKYYDYDFLSVFLYVGAVVLCICLGFILRKKGCIVTRHNGVTLKKIKIEKIVRFSLNIALFAIVLEFFCLITQMNLSMSLAEMGKNYISVRQKLDSQGYNIGIIVRFVTGVFRNISLVLGFYYFPVLKRKYKVELGVYLCLLVLVNIIGYGTQKVLGDILLFFLVSIFIRMMSWSQQKRIKMLLLCFLVCCVVVLVFAVIQNQRYEAIGVTAQNYESRSDGSTYYDLNNIVFKIFGTTLGFGIGSVLSYVSGGYYGLSLTFKLPFVWTYGIGSSYFLCLISEKVFKYPMYENTYLGRLEEFGRDGLTSWNTIFPWLASDYTFLGVLIIFIFVGYFITAVWYEVVKYKNPVSMVMFATLCLGICYLPANNQLFHGIDSFIATVFTLVWWILCHKNYNVMENYE